MKKENLYFGLTKLVGVLILYTFAALNESSAQWLYPDLFSWAKQGKYMYDVEIDRTQGKLLRFSVAIGNKGAGPFELHGVVESDGTTTATQWIFDDQGNHTERNAGTFVFSDHAGHNHFHFANFANYRLRAVVGKNGVGDVVAVSDKVGFAMFDSAPYNLSLNGAPSSPVYVRQEQSSLDPEGISIGWADVYARTLGDQWIDIAGVRDGQYWIEVTVDPNGLIAESDETNNTAYVKVVLKGNHVKTKPDQPTGISSQTVARSSAMSVEATSPSPSTQVSPSSGAEIITTYPNPSRGEFDAIVTDESTGVYQLRVLDFSGKPLSEQQIIRGEDGVASAHFDLTQAKEGIYVLSVYHN